MLGGPVAGRIVRDRARRTEDLVDPCATVPFNLAAWANRAAGARRCLASRELPQQAAPYSSGSVVNWSGWPARFARSFASSAFVSATSFG